MEMANQHTQQLANKDYESTVSSLKKDLEHQKQLQKLENEKTTAIYDGKLAVMAEQNKQKPVIIDHQLAYRAWDPLFPYDLYELRISRVIPSSILSGSMKKMLLSMLPYNLKKFRRIHEGAASAATFDKIVKGFGPTLIVIRANTQFIFGAYVVDRWGSGGSWISGSRETFLFSLGANGIGNSLKLVHSGNGNGIHITSCGLHLGDSGDLVAFCSHSCAVPQTYSVIAPGFQYQPLTANTLAGTSTWTVVQAEIFSEED